MYNRVSPLVHGYRVTTDAEGLFGPGDRIVGSPVRFRPEGAPVARGGWIWSGIWARNNQRYRHISDTGWFHLGRDGRTYFVPDTYRPAAAGGFVASVMPQTGSAPPSDDLTNAAMDPEALWAWLSGKGPQTPVTPQGSRPTAAKPVKPAPIAPPEAPVPPRAKTPSEPGPLRVQTVAPDHIVVHNFIAPTRQSDLTYSGGDRLDLTDLQRDSTVPITVSTVKISEDAQGDATLVFPTGDRLTLRGVPCASAAHAGFLATIGVPSGKDRAIAQQELVA